jgi:small nuclear ribonucleoprotein (snRNP)-like protein
MKIERPLDFLNDLKGHRVIVKLKGSDNILIWGTYNF